MQSIAPIVGDVLNGKETYPKWSRKIKKSIEPVEESLDFVQKTKNWFKDPSKGDCSKRGQGRRNFRGRRGKKQKIRSAVQALWKESTHIRSVLGFVGLHQIQN